MDSGKSDAAIFFAQNMKRSLAKATENASAMWLGLVVVVLVLLVVFLVLFVLLVWLGLLVGVGIVGRIIGSWFRLCSSYSPKAAPRQTQVMVHNALGKNVQKL